MDGTTRLFPDEFDPIYFAGTSWTRRVDHWFAKHRVQGFSEGNLKVIRQLLADPETGLRMVVNITADALLSFIREGAYRNLYETPVIGGSPKEVSKERRRVDELLDLDGGFYFGAVALGGAGVRFYGEYCMVLKPSRVGADTRLFDRDSYDLLLSPLAELDLNEKQIRYLRGSWADDVVDMAMLRILPQIGHDSRLVTSGTVSELVLKDQEFVEAHLKDTFTPSDLEEIRESPDDTAIELNIDERDRRGSFSTMIEREWARRRSAVAQAIDAQGIRHRVVTLHGRGYQWK